MDLKSVLIDPFVGDTSKMFEEDWITLQGLIRSGELDDAEVFVKKMHQTYHKHAFLHARIHFALSRIARLRKAYLWSIGQWIVGAIFAIPVSLFQKYS
ncbi:MAG: hypothetical protein KAR12_12560 [Methylococcales bacterium]|nr:hypothetical protein [Methylococcales bacterium]